METNLPGIALDKLPGPARGKYPALYFRDEIVWSPSKQYLSLAYTINEASMCNDIGCILWASFELGRATVLGNPTNFYACCWDSPWCIWINDQTFVFKVQHYDGRKLHLPLVAVNVFQGFAILPNTNHSKSRPTQIQAYDGPFTLLNNTELFQAIQNCP